MPYDKKSEEVKKYNFGADYVSNDILNINEKGEYVTNDILKIEEHSKCFYQKCKCNNSNYKQ